MFKKSLTLRKIRQGLEDAQCLGVALRNAGLKSYTTIERWRKRPMIDRYIEACINKSGTRRINAVEDALFKSAVGGNTTAMIFFLTNRYSERWQDRRNMVFTGKDGESLLQTPIVNYIFVNNKPLEKQENRIANDAIITSQP